MAIIKAPRFIDKVNFVIDYWASDCREEPIIYVETLLPCVLKAVGAYFIPSVKGVQTERVKDLVRTQRARSHRGRKSKSRKFVPDGSEKMGRVPKLSTDLNEMIGKGLNTTIAYEPVELIAANKFLFRLLGMGNFVTNWLFIANLTFDGIYEWTSLLQKRCKDYGKGSGGAGGYDDAGWAAGLGGDWNAPPLAIKNPLVQPYSSIHPGTPTSYDVRPFDFYFTVSIKMVAESFGSGTLKLGARHLRKDGTTVIEQLAEHTLTPNEVKYDFLQFWSSKDDVEVAWYTIEAQTFGVSLYALQMCWSAGRDK